jgi:RNA polymerase sigma factor (sigma-70 family)
MPNLSPSSVLLRTQSDERLVVLARGGSERAFEAIVERYRGVLLRGARRFLPDARAEDALQQAFLSAWSALQRGDEVRDLRAWLYKIVVNTALNQLRVSGYDYAELRESLRGGEAPQEEMERRAVVRETLAALAGLPERQREALLRIAVEGRSQDEVARELGVSEGAVRQLVHRARLTLRAAATVIVPLPLAQWAAAAAGTTTVAGPTAERIAELVAGAGAGAFAAKAGTVAVLATTTAVAGPAIVTSGVDEPARSARAPQQAEERRARERPPPARPSPSAPVIVVVPGEPRRTSPQRESARERPKTRRSRPSRRARTFDSSGPSSRSGSGSGGGSGSSGPGSSGSSGPGRSGSSDSSGSGSSGSGSSGSGRSGSSGSGSSGSGSSGSGSSGSGSSGSGSSGSGSSGSGSSGSSSGPGSGDSPDTSGSSSGPGSGDDSDTSGPGSGGSGDSSGPGSGDDSDDSSGSGSSGSGSSGSGSSGSGSGDDGQR